jgi:hypothetical protein
MIPDKAFDALCCGARAAMKAAWEDAQATAPGFPDEVDHIFALTATGTRELANNWGPVLRPLGLSLRVTGVFCHQTPKAHYSRPGVGPKSPELGDLLIVHEHQWPPDRGAAEGQRSRHAVLVQAKMTRSGVPSTPDPDQEWLYENWPPFELRGRGPKGTRFLPGTRNLSPNDGGSCYGLIAKDGHVHQVSRTLPYCCGFPTWFADPRDNIRTAGAEDAGAYIAGMLYDCRKPRGRHARIPPNPLTLTGISNDDFDVTVEELLTITAAKTLRFKNKAHISGTRGHSGLACFQFSHGLAMLPPTGGGFAAKAPGGEDVPPEDFESDFDDGISVLLIETGGEGRRPDGESDRG